jgi:glycosyltransferase involved in cell wall biosynthesis
VVPYLDYPGWFPLIMAMTGATPVIASDAYGNSEYVDGGGIVVSAGSVDELSESIKRMIVEPGLADQLGKKAIKNAEECFSWEVVGKRTIDLYEHLLEGV